jgi:hypothetical protein
VGGKYGFLLVALVALMLATPLIVEGRAVTIGMAVLTSAVLVAGLLAARPGVRSLVIGVLLALVDVGAGRLIALQGSKWLVLLQALLWLATLIYVTATILEALFENRMVGIETLQAALCVFLLLGLTWVYLFGLIDLAVPDSFEAKRGPRFSWSDDRSRRSEFMRLYVYSYAKLSGSGETDLAPATDFARIATALEAMTGQIYIAVVIARLVALAAHSQPSRSTTIDGEIVINQLKPD